MLTWLNRKELIITFDVNRLAEIRNILTKHDIDYYIKTVNRSGVLPVDAGIGGRIGRVGERQDFMCEYVVYVHKNDYKKAKEIL